MSTGEMKVVATKQGIVYLVMIGDDPITADAIQADTRGGGVRWPPIKLQSYLGQGYWEECEHSDELLAMLMAFRELEIK